MENIKSVSLTEQHLHDYIWYAIYVARKRAVPDARDGLKSVHRRILYAMYNDEHAYRYNGNGRGKVKTATVIGTTIGRYHPHGDAAVGDAIKPMVNWFEIKQPLIYGDSFGDPTGFRMSHPRYTEIELSQYALDCIVSDMKEAYNSVDWDLNFSDTLKEPRFFPASVPNLLINGSYGIAVGLAVDIPRHNLGEVVDATIKLLHNPNAKIVLVPDNCMDTDIIDTDWKTISETGRGKYRVRGRVEICEFSNHKYKNNPALKITSVPDLVFFNSIQHKIEELIDPKDNKLPQVVDIVSNSGYDDKTDKFRMEFYVVLKKGTDPNYVRNFLYANTPLENSRGVNFEVLYGDKPVLMGYKQYLLNFIEFRKITKFRMYCNRMSEAKTKYHEMELYIKVMESKEFDNIISMIRKQKGTDDKEYIEYFVNKLGVTDIQARYLLNINLKKLSPGYYEKYKQIMQEQIEKAGHYFDMMNCEDLLIKEIEEELLSYKKKYGAPRMSKIISAAEASNIPSGIFRVIITKNNFIKKMDTLSDNIGSLGGDEALCVFDADNTDNILIFSKLGKVFKLAVSKIPFAPKGNPGADIRKLLKNLTSDICNIVTESALIKFSEDKQHNFIYVLTRNGYIKRMDCDDFLTIMPSGTIYSKLEEDDSVIDVIFLNNQMDFIVYSRNKALRLSGMDAPYLKRSTKGLYSMKTQYPMDGIGVVLPNATCIVAITSNGYVNKVPITVLPRGKRMHAGTKMIKLHDHDSIVKISACTESNAIKLYSGANSSIIQVSEIPVGASIGSGVKLANRIYKADIM